MAEAQMRVRFTPMREGLGQVFGPLEAEIMRLVWSHGQSTVKQIHRILSRRREIAYTTVMTTMGRLAEKGVLERSRQGVAYLYRPSMSKAEFDQWVMRSVMSGLIDTFDTKAIDLLVEYLSQERPEQLRHLRQALGTSVA